MYKLINKEKQELKEVLKFPIEIFGIQNPEILNKNFQISKQFVLWNPEPRGSPDGWIRFSFFFKLVINTTGGFTENGMIDHKCRRYLTYRQLKKKRFLEV